MLKGPPRKGPPPSESPAESLDIAAKIVGKVMAAMEDEAIKEAKEAAKEKAKDNPKKGEPPKQVPEPKRSLRIYERRQVWAWLHQASDDVLRELYQITMDKHGMAELGHLLREYFTMRKYYPNNPLTAKRCPFCKLDQQEQTEIKPVKKMPGKK